MATEKESHTALVLIQPLAFGADVQAIHLSFDRINFAELAAFYLVERFDYERVVAIHIARRKDEVFRLYGLDEFFENGKIVAALLVHMDMQAFFGSHKRVFSEIVIVCFDHRRV